MKALQGELEYSPDPSALMFLSNDSFILSHCTDTLNVNLFFPRSKNPREETWWKGPSPIYSIVTEAFLFVSCV